MFNLTHKFSRLGTELSVPHKPLGLRNPEWVMKNVKLAHELELPSCLFNTDQGLTLLSGNDSEQSASSVAQVYAGHQFGNFNPFLGDGRSVILGEIDIQKGIHEISLKGIGPTPFTFRSHGRATLAECIHEYKISEQLAAKQIPTTRCLSIIQGSEQLLEGGASQPTAVLCRVAPSFVRFGSFEACYFKKEFAALKALANHLIKHHFPDVVAKAESEDQGYAMLFAEIVSRTASLVAQWQNHGFVHGMMNTDNFSAVGITLDLGASTFIEEPEASFVSSALDTQGRYAFGQQPAVGLWNCNVLAKAMSPLISSDDLKSALSTYETTLMKQLKR